MDIKLGDVLHDSIIHIVFDVAAAGVFLLAVYLSWLWRFPQEMEKLSDKLSGRYFTAIGAGAVLGSYFLGSLNSLVAGEFSINRSVLGGLAGAIAAVELWKRARGLRGSTGYIYALPLALMVAVGRMGCALSGMADNTYGVPTQASWGWDFGDGIPRHPVALYESVSMLVLALFFLVALGRRAAWYPRLAFYLFAGVYGAQRFAWEFLKPYPSLVWKLNIFHLTCVGMVLYAVVFSVKSVREAKQ